MLAFLSLLVPLAGSTYWVAPQGSDQSQGNQARPWGTLRHALTSLRPGDTLIVKGGEYNEVMGEGAPPKIRPGTPSAPILVKAAPGERPVLRGLLWLNSPSYWTIDGLNVTWKEGLSPRSHMVKFTNGVGWKYTNSEVWGAKSYAGILVAGTKPNEPSDWTISHNTIHDTASTNRKNQDHLIYVNTGLQAGPGLIERNLLYNALNGNGIKLAGAKVEQGTVNVTVRYNTIVNTAQGVLVGGMSANNKIYRNLFKKVGKNYGAIRGYRLAGTGNIAYDNIVDEARYTVLNDEGFPGVRDNGDNLLMDCDIGSGFKPKNPRAQKHGKDGR